MNDYERGFSDPVAGTGFQPLRSGWPDFAILDQDGSLHSVVELKRPNEPVPPHQVAVHDALRRCGIRVVVLRGEWEIHAFLGELKAIASSRDAKLLRRLQMVNNLPVFGSYEPVVNAS